MLRRATVEIGPDTMTRLIIGGIYLILLLMLATALYNVFVPTQDSDFDLFAEQLDAVTRTGSGALDDNAPRRFVQNVFFLTGHEDDALVVFGDTDEPVTLKMDRILDKDIVAQNPCDGPCVCQVELGEPIRERDCRPLRSEGLVAYSLVSKEQTQTSIFNWNQAVYDTTVPQEQAYPLLGPGAMYAPVYIPFKGADATGGGSDEQRSLLVYVEYLPAHEANGRSVGARLLINSLPADSETALESLFERRDDLDLCFGSGACEYVPVNGVTSNGKVCRRVGNTCEAVRADPCKPGPVTDTCACGSTVIREGVCVKNGADWASYDESSLCEGVDSCADYCESDCTVQERHACTVDVCAVRSLCAPSDDGTACEDADSAVGLLVQRSTEMLQRGPGYRYSLVDVPRAGSAILGVSSGVNIACDGPSEECRQFRFDGDRDGISRFGTIAPAGCDGQACLCALGSRATLPWDGDAIDNKQITECVPIGDAWLVGDSQQHFVGDSAGVRFGFSQDQPGVLLDRKGMVALLEVFVPDTGRPIVRLTELGRDPTGSIDMGCDPQSGTCPPIPAE